MEKLPGKPIEPRADYYLVVMTAQEFHALPKRIYNWLQSYNSRNYTNGSHVWIEISKYEMRALLRVIDEVTNA